MRISAKTKKWITFGSMVVLAASSITSPIDLKGMLPDILSKPVIGEFTILNLAAYTVLLGAYWVITRQTE